MAEDGLIQRRCTRCGEYALSPVEMSDRHVLCDDCGGRPRDWDCGCLAYTNGYVIHAPHMCSDGLSFVEILL